MNPCGTEIRPYSLTARPYGIKQDLIRRLSVRPCGISIRPCEINIRPCGLRVIPYGIKTRPYGITIRPYDKSTISSTIINL